MTSLRIFWIRKLFFIFFFLIEGNNEDIVLIATKNFQILIIGEKELDALYLYIRYSLYRGLNSL